MAKAKVLSLHCNKDMTIIRGLALKLLDQAPFFALVEQEASPRLYVGPFENTPYPVLETPFSLLCLFLFRVG
jgi:hypothetical protein